MIIIDMPMPNNCYMCGMKNTCSKSITDDLKFVERSHNCPIVAELKNDYLLKDAMKGTTQAFSIVKGE